MERYVPVPVLVPVPVDLRNRVLRPVALLRDYSDLQSFDSGGEQLFREHLLLF
jgi:hypothetical protein